jgi:RNA polymerase sigma-70 factor (ECF subfamily)
MQAESPAKGVQPLNQLSDHDLILAFKEGSRGAMEEIVGRYEASIFNFGRKMCGNTHDAEDITQDTFLNAFRYLEDFREEAKLKNWLFKIASSVCLKKRRKKKYEPDHEISLESLMEGGGSNQHHDIPDWSGLPLDSMLRKELRQTMEDAIQALPPDYRIVFNLRDLVGFDTLETAEILGISPQAVKTRLYRARVFLREKISNRYREAKRP